MRRTFLYLAVACIAGLLTFVSLVWAGTCSQSFLGERYLQFSWSGNGTIACNSTSRLDGQLLWVETLPTGSPTTDYDIALTSSEGRNLMGGATVDRHTSAIEIVQPKIGASTVTSLPVNGIVTMTITNQNVNAASGKVRLYFIK